MKPNILSKTNSYISSSFIMILPSDIQVWDKWESLSQRLDMNLKHINNIAFAASIIDRSELPITINGPGINADDEGIHKMIYYVLLDPPIFIYRLLYLRAKLDHNEGLVMNI